MIKFRATNTGIQVGAENLYDVDKRWMFVFWMYFTSVWATSAVEAIEIAMARQKDQATR